MPWYSVPTILKVSQLSSIVCPGQTTHYSLETQGVGVLIISSDTHSSWPGSRQTVFIDGVYEFNLPVISDIRMMLIGPLGISRKQISTPNTSPNLRIVRKPNLPDFYAYRAVIKYVTVSLIKSCVSNEFIIRKLKLFTKFENKFSVRRSELVISKFKAVIPELNVTFQKID